MWGGGRELKEKIQKRFQVKKFSALQGFSISLKDCALLVLSAKHRRETFLPCNFSVDVNKQSATKNNQLFCILFQWNYKLSLLMNNIIVNIYTILKMYTKT